ncbi:hypothetical protein V7138_07030 [Bacillus sp. JJ1533]|uniref:hypothetical protein n=1 Tax=Bacillus sp. JJ1533 TaxID=3122959 RepID=UPI002FFE6A85
MIQQHEVEKIVREVLRLIEFEKQHKKPKLLVLHQESEKSLQQIERLKRYWDIEQIPFSCHEIPSGFHHAVFLEVGQDLLVKAALGLADTPESILFSKLMYQEYRVDFIPDDNLSWMIESEENCISDNMYLRKLVQYKLQLHDYGVHIYPLSAMIPIENISNSTQQDTIRNRHTSNEKLLTKEIVEKWEMKSILVHPKTIITPLARDIAKEKGISIKFLNQNEG